MATYQNQEVITLVSAGDLSADQFHFLTVDATGKVAVSGNGDDSVGVLLNDPNGADQAAQVAISGKTRVEAGGGITAGANVASNASGQAVVATASDAILGIAIDGAAGAGEIVSIVFNPRGYA